jgi:small conductance mechanosensitive channel
MVASLETVVFGIVVILVAAFAVGEVVIRVISKLARRAGISPAVIRDVRDAVTVIILAVAITGIAGLTGLSSEFTTLTIGGVAGLAVSLALQTTLTNIISGILMLHDKILHLGDDIEYSGVKGKVVKIGFRNTWIRDEKNSIIVISNASLASGPLTNHTASARLSDLLNAR